MTALSVSGSESAVRAAVERLSRIQPGAYQVVSCYLKLEPRDKTRGKYLIKIKNRIRDALAALQRQDLERALRAQVAGDLERVQAYFGEPTRLPPARGIALFACGALDLFEVLPLPHVHRSRLAVAAVPLIRELVALEEEFGTILVAACDRTSARFFEVTAYDAVELASLTAEATRPGKFTASARRSGETCSQGASGSTTTTCGSGRNASDTMHRWRTGSSRFTLSARSPGSWSPASAWTRRPCCPTCTPTSTTSSWAWCA